MRIAVGYLRQVILSRKYRVPIDITQGESVLEATSDVLTLECGILDIARLDLLVEGAIVQL